MRLAAFAAAIGIAAMAGCGGGEDDGTAGTSGSTESTATTSAPPLSKSQFIRQADAICKQGGSQTEIEIGEFLTEKAITENAKLTATQVSEIGSKVMVPALRRQQKELEALEPPEADVDQVEEFRDGIDAAIGELEEKPEQAKATDKLFADTDKIAQAYGFKVCGNR